MNMIMPAEFERRMKTVCEIEDPEERHAEADVLMCEVLISLGYQAGVEVFDKVEKWYA